MQRTVGVDLDVIASLVGVRRAELVRRLVADGQNEEVSLDRYQKTAEDFGEEEEKESDTMIALITAARRGPRKGKEEEWLDQPKELLEIGGKSVICHSLRALEEAGVGMTVIVMGYRGLEIREHIELRFSPSRRRRRHSHRRSMRLEFVDLGHDWRGTHAESILAARAAMLKTNLMKVTVPILLVTSDHLFDPALLEEMAQPGLGDALLVEDRLQEDKEAALPVTAVRVRTVLQSRRLPKNEKEEDDEAEEQPHDAHFWCERVGRRLDEFDGYDAGLARLETTRLWLALERLSRRQPRKYFALCDALDSLARKRQLRAVFTQDRPWIALETEKQYNATKRELLTIGKQRNQKSSSALTAMLRTSSSEQSLTALAAVQDAVRARHRSLSFGTSPPKYNVIACNNLARSQSFHLDEEAHWLDDLIELRANTASIGVLVMQTYEEKNNNNDEPNKVQNVSDLAAYALLPSELATESAVAKEEHEARCGHHSDLADQFLSPGIDDSTDLLSLAIEASADLKLKDDTHVAVRVDRRVPMIGWLILTLATILQASGALIFDALDKSIHPPSQAALNCWRPLAATLAVSPLALASRITSAESYNNKETTQYTSQRTKPVLLLGILAFWISNSTYAFAFALARSPNDVVLATSLTPLCIVLARGIGFFGTFPTYDEVKGTLIALGGAVLCALAGGHSTQSDDASSEPLLALALCLICVTSHAVFSITTKICRTHYSAPVLHFAMQAGSAIIAILVLILRSFYLGESPSLGMNPQVGVLGLLAPSRIVTFAYTGFCVDTFGTLGYVVALHYVDPLLTTVATLFQPLCAALEAAAYYADPTRIPPINYYIGTIILVYGSSLIVRSQAHTSRIYNADPAIIQSKAR